MSARAKYAIVHHHKEDYPISIMCRFFGVSRSGYYDFVHRMDKPDVVSVIIYELKKLTDRIKVIEWKLGISAGDPSERGK